MSEPSTNRTQNDGERDENGRFRPGCKGGPGNPYAAQVGKTRAATYKAMRPSADARLALKTLRRVMRKGKDCDAVRAAKVMLDLLVNAETLERLEQLEQRVGTMNMNGNGRHL